MVEDCVFVCVLLIYNILSTTIFSYINTVYLYGKCIVHNIKYTYAMCPMDSNWKWVLHLANFAVTWLKNKTMFWFTNIDDFRFYTCMCTGLFFNTRKQQRNRWKNSADSFLRKYRRRKTMATFSIKKHFNHLWIETPLKWDNFI